MINPVTCRATRRLGISLAAAALLYCGCAAPGVPSEGQAVLRGPASTQGILRVREANGGVHIRGVLMGLPPGPYALYVARSGSCGAATASLRNASLQGQAPDLQGPLVLFRTDDNGSARIDLVTSELHPGQGAQAVLGRSLVVEKAFSNAGNGAEAGPLMVACGSVRD